ncbi:MAG: hypothetical protein LUC34_03065 [Campylobacter sp.]|nr:hypothetical protein [Campylobacter sp.]
MKNCLLDFNFADILKDNFNFSDFLERYHNPYLFPEIYDPIVLDLNKDGIKTLSLGEGVF